MSDLWIHDDVKNRIPADRRLGSHEGNDDNGGSDVTKGNDEM